MKPTYGLVGKGVALALVLVPAIAGAQTTSTTTIGSGSQPAALPPPESSNDPHPPVAAPAVPEGGVVQQAGVGGRTAYGRAGVLELGGSLGFNHAGSLTSLNISPSLGWFFMDNFEISAIVGFNYVNASSVSATALNILAEPSFHIPFSQTVFGFLGVGVGLGYSNSAGAGFALAPRLGANIMVGRSGVFTPALQFVYSTTDIVTTSSGMTLVGVSTSFGVSAGYTVMW
jgi:hypothetical protein